jgi:predicted MFS family arabinose efflux permease
VGILDILAGPVKGLIGGVGDIIDNLHTSGEEKAEARQKLEALEAATLLSLSEVGKTLVEAQRDAVVAEAKGESWMQRNWRPLTMLVFVFIIFNNFVLVPYVSAFGGAVPALDIPNGMWALLNVGIGGYITSRGIEKVVKLKKE